MAPTAGAFAENKWKLWGSDDITGMPLRELVCPSGMYPFHGASHPKPKHRHEGGLPPARTSQGNDTSRKTLGDGEGQGGLACCSPWGRKKSDTTERLNKKAFYLHHLSGNFLRCNLPVLSSADSIKLHLPFIAFLSQRLHWR